MPETRDELIVEIAMSEMTRPTRYALLAVVIVGAVLTHWIALAGTLVVNGPDIKIHYRWALQFAAALADGVAYPRWAAYSYLGLGDPSFLYIHPLFYYVVAAVDAAVGNAWVSILVVVALSSAATSVATFCVARENTTDALAILAAGAAALSPYAFHLTHYQQFLPMQFAMPMLVLFVGVVWSSSGRLRIPATALCLALLVGSHILTAFIALICTGIIVLWRAVREGAPGRRLLLQHAAGVALGLGLSAIYLYPALTTQTLISPEGWYAPIHLDWKNAFLLQYFTLPAFGFRWFHLQWTIPLLTVLACAAAGYLLHSARSRREIAWRRTCEMLAVAVVALFLGSEISYPLWEHSGILRKIQFPLRFLQIASVASVIALAWSVALAPDEKRRIAWLLIGGYVAGSAAMLTALERQFAIEAKPALSVASPSRSFGGQAEMKPAGVGSGWRKYVDLGGWQADCRAIGATCTQSVDGTHHKIWVVDLPQAQTTSLRFPVFWFPAWRFAVNDTVVTPSVEKDTGLPGFQLPPGRTVVEAVWAGLPQERVGSALSAIAALIVAGLVLATRGARYARHKPVEAAPRLDQKI